MAIMHKKLSFLPLFFLLIINLQSRAQVVVYSEDFDGALTWTLNTDLGVEGDNPANWYVSCEEEGVGEGVCGETCGAGDQTLHIGLNPVAGDNGANYLETGFGVTTTNRRAESADISTIGHADLTLNFDMIGKGGGTDYGEVFYSIDGGVTWTSIDSPLESLCCGGVPCTGAEQGLWETKSYALPVECEEIANLRISFVWQNIDDGVATDPSIAVDNITITKPVVAVDGGPTALFDPETITVCRGESITYTDLSTTDDVITDWNWDFEGGDPGMALTEGPHTVTYITPGVYTTTLTVTDGIGSHDTSFVVTVLDGPYAGESDDVEVCVDEITNLNDFLAGADAGGTWTETSGVPSGGFTPGTGELDATGLTPGDIYEFEYETLPGAAPCEDADIATITVTIIECGPLNASFIPESTEICAGDCISFTNNSSGTGISGYGWIFTDPDIGPLAGEDPGTVCFPNAGEIGVTLNITDGETFDDTTITITVNPSPEVTAEASSTTVCAGGGVTLTATGDADDYIWSDGVIDGEEFFPIATSLYTVTATNEFGCSSEDDITITVVDCDPISAGFSYSDLVCVGDCVTFTDTSSGDPVEWLWTFGGIFGGDVEPTASTDQNPTACFNVPGVFDVQLTVTNALGESSSTTHSITVFPSPTVVAGTDTIIELGGSALLFANASIPSGDFIWTPDEYIDCEDCPSTMASPPEDMVYEVKFVDVNGCSDTDTVRVFVNFIEALGVPDAFSPNGDGKNDVLYVKGFGLEKMTLTIFNKYGELIFESRDQRVGWDGTFRGRPENPGVFTWVLEYQFINGKGGSLKGTTTLVK